MGPQTCEAIVLPTNLPSEPKPAAPGTATIMPGTVHVPTSEEDDHGVMHIGTVSIVEPSLDASQLNSLKGVIDKASRHAVPPSPPNNVHLAASAELGIAPAAAPVAGPALTPTAALQSQPPVGLPSVDTGSETSSGGQAYLAEAGSFMLPAPPPLGISASSDDAVAATEASLSASQQAVLMNAIAEQSGRRTT